MWVNSSREVVPVFFKFIIYFSCFPEQTGGNSLVPNLNTFGLAAAELMNLISRKWSSGTLCSVFPKTFGADGQCFFSLFLPFFLTVYKINQCVLLKQQ